MAHENKTIIVADEGMIRRITLNRPQFLNAYNHVLCHEVTEAVDDYMKKDALRCLIITGAGRGFCAGGDISGTEPWNRGWRASTCRSAAASRCATACTG